MIAGGLAMLAGMIWLLLLLYATLAAGVWWTNQPRPKEETGHNILRTDEQGAVELTTDGQRLWVETAR